MADRQIFIDDSPKNPDVKLSPFDHTFTTNITGKFGKVNCAFLKYYPAKSKVKIKPFFGFDMQPLVFPVQTNVRCHLKFYKVPLRILWQDWEDFASSIGSDGLPVNGGGHQFVVPYIKRSTGWNDIGSFAEQIGCCNKKYVGIQSNQVCGGQRVCYTVENSISSSPTHTRVRILPIMAQSTESRGLLVELPDGYGLKPQTYTTFQNHFCSLYFVDDNSTAVDISGKVFVKLVNLSKSYHSSHVHQVHDDYDIIHETEISYLANTASAFNSYNGSAKVQHVTIKSVNVDGVTLYEHGISMKIKDDTFFTLADQMQQRGMRIGLLFSFEVGTNIERCMNYNPFDLSRFILQTDLDVSQMKPNGQTSGTYDFVNLPHILAKNFGIVSSVLLSTISVGLELDTKFDSVNGADPVQPICALPFRALEFIHNYFMRNPRIDPFKKGGVPTYNKFLTNTSSGADATTPVDSWNALYETDYFTSCVKEPQFGNAPLVGVTVNDMSDTGILTFSDGTGYNDYTVKLDIDENGAVLPLTAYKEIADKPNIQRLKEIVNFGISINDLRNVSTFQRMLERMQRTGYRYQNVIYEFFGTNPPVGDHYPQYIGGLTRNMTVNKITQIAETEQKKLGEFAGQAHFNGEGDEIECFMTEPCYIVGIQYFTVTPTYSQYLPKHLLYKDPLDFYLNPDFAYMGPQPVYKKEIAPNQISVEHLNDVFGYNRPYAELFSNVDEVHGLYKTEMSNYLLQRYFADAPELNKSFIEINADDLLNIFSVVENDDKIFGQVMFKIHAELPAPRSYMPRSI